MAASLGQGHVQAEGELPDDGKGQRCLVEAGLLDYIALDQVAEAKFICTNLITLQRFAIESRQVEVEIDKCTKSYQLLALQDDDEWELVDPSDRFSVALV